MRQVRERGRLVWRCPYSHQPRYQETGSSMRHCNSCGANYPYTAYHRC